MPPEHGFMDGRMIRMTIRKKGSRLITIGHEQLRWIVTPSSKGVIALTAQHVESNGRIVRVFIQSDINEFWIEFPYVGDLNLKVVKPAEVSKILSDAIAHGWDPRSKGSPLNFSLCGNKLVETEKQNRHENNS